MSTRIGTIATPARRSGLVAHSSASQRLCARAPAMSSSGAMSPVAPRPAPNGAEAPDGHRVGVGEDDLAGDPVGVELLVAPARVPTAAQALFVLLLPLVGELLVQESLAMASSAIALTLDERGVELLAVLGVEPLAVLRARESGVAVGRDHQVRLVMTSSSR